MQGTSCHYKDFLSNVESDLGTMPDWRTSAFWHNSSFQQAWRAFLRTDLAMSHSRRDALVQHIRCAIDGRNTPLCA